MSNRRRPETLLEKQEQQFCKDFERLTLLLATVGRRKPRIQPIVSEHLNIPLQPSFTWKDEFKKGKMCGRNTKFFQVEGKFIFAHVPLINILSRKRLSVEARLNAKDSDTEISTKCTVAPIVSSVPADSRLNSDLCSIWSVCRLPSPSTAITSITIVQTFANHPRIMQCLKIEPHELGKLDNPFTDACTREDIEVLIEFHLLYDARAAIDADKYSPDSLKAILDSFVGNGNFKEYKFDGFYCFFGGGSDEFADSMVFLPDWAGEDTWSIYEGDQLMPRRIYVTARMALAFMYPGEWHASFPARKVLELTFFCQSYNRRQTRRDVNRRATDRR
uniref:HTH_48 domain-containing protein n=1 Tax=Panagrellus redivivus TaxID=6233 RepID=A0A7E4VY42_PANRE